MQRQTQLHTYSTVPVLEQGLAEPIIILAWGKRKKKKLWRVCIALKKSSSKLAICSLWAANSEVVISLSNWDFENSNR